MLLPRIAGAGWRVCLAAPSGLLADVRSLPGAAEAFPVDIRDRSAPVADLRAALQLRIALRRSGAGLVHCHGIRAAWVSRLARHGPPRVVTVHNLFHLPEGRLGARLARAALAGDGPIIAVSGAVRASLVSAGIAPGRVRVIPNGVEPAPPVAPEEADAFRQSLGLGPGQPLAACVARLMPDKGVDVLLEAWRAAAPRLPGGALVIAGDGPDRAALEAAAQSLPEVRFTGFLADVRPLYAAADVLVIPSRREGQSIVCLEAMTSEPPPALIVTAAGGLPEMVRDGETGLVVPVEDAEALAGAMVRLMRDGGLRERLSRSAARLARERYSAEGMAEATLEVYRRIASGASSAGAPGGLRP